MIGSLRVKAKFRKNNILYAKLSVILNEAGKYYFEIIPKLQNVRFNKETGIKMSINKLVYQDLIVL